MLTIGIETSCDETSCAVLEGQNRIRSNIVSSSLLRHAPYGGIVPEIASRHCLEQIDFVFSQALKKAHVKAKDCDLVAVTEGPGLIGSLLVGVCFAKALSYGLGVPLVAVNHLDAHLESAFISNEGKFRGVLSFRKPARYVGLLVSGGHTLLTYHVKDKVKKLGETVDDAAGEAYDKVAKILGLGYPGGPAIDRLSREGNLRAIAFTKPKQSQRFGFSFSGIKTAVLYYVEKQKKHGLSRTAFKTMQKDIAASFQHAVVQWLVEKTLDAAEVQRVRDIVVGGGVSANSLLRQRLAAEGRLRGITTHFPHLSLTNDNAVMIARRGVDLYKRKQWADWTLAADPNLKMV